MAAWTYLPLRRASVAMLSTLAAIGLLLVTWLQSSRATVAYSNSRGLGTACPSTLQKPNLILSAMDGDGMLEKIFVFMGTLDTALGNEMLAAHRDGNCPPADVDVKILTPPSFAQDLPEGFKSLLRRHKNLKFLGILPEEIDAGVVFRRFPGWSQLVELVQPSYDKVLSVDLDIVFQSNPFSMHLDRNVALLFFGEWHGFKIGQCPYHVEWYTDCASASAESYLTEEHFKWYAPLDRICAGSTYGTARGMAIYLDLMASELAASKYRCNDQALHTHLYYSGKLQEALSAKSAGLVKLVPNAEALLGTVGTTPYVRYNEWGEVLNDLGQVQAAVHQFKHHDRLDRLVRHKYGWQSPLSTNVPPTVTVVKNKDFSASDPSALARYELVGVDNETCNRDDSLCSCRWDNCQFDWYE